MYTTLAHHPAQSTPMQYKHTNTKLPVTLSQILEGLELTTHFFLSHYANYSAVF